MLVLSILIMLALGAAVVSFFIAGAQWLLLVSAALVLFAFYLSRRGSSLMTSNDSVDRSRSHREQALPPTTIGGQLPEPTGDHAHRQISTGPRENDHPAGDTTDTAGTADASDDDHPAGPHRDRINRPNRRPENGHAIAS
jgi:hypothetical protein